MVLDFSLFKVVFFHFKLSRLISEKLDFVDKRTRYANKKLNSQQKNTNTTKTHIN